jgi:predicted HicB family RNase H-like nuclease
MVSLHGLAVAGETGERMKGPLKRDKRLSVRVPEEMLKRLRVVAMADGRSLADWSFRAVERELVRAEARLARQRSKPER